MTWSYRIIRRKIKHSDEHYYAIHEAYYKDDDPDKIDGITINPVTFGGEGDNKTGKAEVIASLKMALKNAEELSILNYEEY